MALNNISLFAGLGAKMDYLTTRQTVISQNVANVNTAGYIPRDLEPADFGAILRNSNEAGRITPVATSTAHLGASDSMAGGHKQKADTAYDIAPSGNAVIIEEQMMKASQTAMDYSLMSTLYQKNVGMIRMALGGTA